MRDFRQYIVIAAFMVLPFMFISHGIVHEGHHIAFVFLALVLAASQIKNNWIFSFLIYLYAWMLFICLYRLFYLVPGVIFVQAIDQYVYYIAGAVVFIAVTRSQLSNEFFYNAICIAALIQCALAVAQHFWIDPVVWFLSHFINAMALLDEHCMIGSMGNNNFLCGFLAISLPFFFRRNWFYAIPLLAFVLYFGRTTSAFVPAVLGTAYFYHDRVHWKYLVGGGLVAALIVTWYAIFNHTPFYSNPRWKDWADALTIWSQSTFGVTFGMGPGANWGKGYPMHNEWLQVLYQFGVAGMSIFVGYVVTIHRKNRILFTSFIIILINMFGNYPLHLTPSAFLIIIVAGLIEREKVR